ncbi:cupin domain-containing protein [Methanogenium cariaci]|uniref:cupin domain-containing protein n=1 Tax=Methanogenium cariaci TaxID=2197 RepID=UPI0012F68936|nr:cupin domain-containing protein [Methanogenium cariaci]
MANPILRTARLISRPLSLLLRPRPLFLSVFHSADQYAFGRIPPGWFGTWHPTPRRQFFFQSAGEVEVKVSDGGEVRRFHPGNIILLEDTGGKGHITRVIGTEDVCAAFVQLPDEISEP